LNNARKETRQQTFEEIREQPEKVYPKEPKDYEALLETTKLKCVNVARREVLNALQKVNEDYNNELKDIVSLINIF
jgi:hypothetical protein